MVLLSEVWWLTKLSRNCASEVRHHLCVRSLQFWESLFTGMCLSLWLCTLMHCIILSAMLFSVRILTDIPRKGLPVTGIGGMVRDQSNFILVDVQ